MEHVDKLVDRIVAAVNCSFREPKPPQDLPESVRGFDYNSLGPKDVDGNVIGGTNLLVGSVEYERHLRGNFYGAIFVDAGNAFDDNDFDSEVGAGLGLKWLSPLGPIRFYLGYPLTDDDASVRFHLRLGADL